MIFVSIFIRLLAILKPWVHLDAHKSDLVVFLQQHHNITVVLRVKPVHLRLNSQSMSDKAYKLPISKEDLLDWHVLSKVLNCDLIV